MRNKHNSSRKLSRLLRENSPITQPLFTQHCIHDLVDLVDWFGGPVRKMGEPQKKYLSLTAEELNAASVLVSTKIHLSSTQLETLEDSVNIIETFFKPAIEETKKVKYASLDAEIKLKTVPPAELTQVQFFFKMVLSMTGQIRRERRRQEFLDTISTEQPNTKRKKNEAEQKGE